MSSTATVIILALWLAFVWFVDPDGIVKRDRRYENRRRHGRNDDDLTPDLAPARNTDVSGSR